MRLRTIVRSTPKEEQEMLLKSLLTITMQLEVDDSKSYYPGQENRYSREFHEVDLQFDHVTSCDIERLFDIDATRGICASRARVAV